MDKGGKQMINYLTALIRGKASDSKGQAMVEYGLLVTLIAIAALVGLALVGPKLSDMFTNIAGRL